MADLLIDLPSIRLAARKLEAGGLVVFPTETVYGLGADAENPTAVTSIYATKGRPSNHPVIVHVAPEADIGHWAASIPPEARALMNAFWPGPLTLILPRAAHIPDQVSGGQHSIGLRCPSHPVAHALLREFKGGKGGIAAPSANKFGHVSPTTAQHVRYEFDADGECTIGCILDGGQSEVGIESTIIDLSRMATYGPVLLRPGHISSAQIAAVLGLTVQSADPAAPRASGTLESHYAPRTPVLLVSPRQLAATLQQLHQAGQKLALIAHSGMGAQFPPLAAQFPMVAESQAYAHDLYTALRSMDHAAADLIVVEAPPSDLVWHGINDRLRRAAHDSSAVFPGFKNNLM